MERYEKYKDSGVEWLGILPEHWQVCDFKRLAIRIEVGIAEAATQAYVEKNGVPILRSTNIKRGIIHGELLEISKEFAEKNNSKKIFKNDLITVRTGNAGLTAVIPEYLDGCQCFTLLVTSLKAEADPYFYNYFLNSEIGEFQFSLSAWGTAQKNISVPILGYTKVILPPKIEQTAIANYLDKKTSELDTLITKKEKLIELLKEERTAIINQAVTKGLDLDVEMKDSGVEWLGEIPAHWKMSKLKYVSMIKYGLGQPPKQKDSGLPIIRATNVFRGKISKENLVFVDPDDIPWNRDPVLKENDIIVVRSGAYTGDSAIIPYEFEGAITGYDMVLRALTVNPKFVAFCLLSTYLLDNQLFLERLRAAQPHLNAEELGNSFLVLPNIEEQNEIVSHIEIEHKRVDDLISKTEQEITLLKEYKTALISEVVTGKVKVI